MRDVIRQLIAWRSQGQRVAYCRLVETRGSTPQKAGAAMLVLADGAQFGTLGGGCVEAEVKRRALMALSTGQPEMARFQLDHDYGWDDGLICGGRMQILIEPFVSDLPAYFLQLSRLLDERRGATEAVVFDEQASGLPVLLSYLFDDRQQLMATLHADAEVHDAPPLVRQHLKPLTASLHSYASHGVAYLTTTSRCRLLIIGAGHIGKAVAELAVDLEFDVWVVDDREEYVSQERFPRVERRVSGPLDQVLPALEVTPDTYCLIVTRGHNHDEQALYYLADRGARYVGMIGSRRKIQMIFEDLLNQGIHSESLARVYAPVGIDIGSQTVAEIAISICAELISHRNRGGKAAERLRT
jgi:xanthine dehydrogenase accessory factor